MTPSIQSDVVSRPYLKLFVPSYPQRHNELFAARCPGVRPLTGGGVRLSLSRDSVPDAAVRTLFDYVYSAFTPSTDCRRIVIGTGRPGALRQSTEKPPSRSSSAPFSTFAVVRPITPLFRIGSVAW